MHRSQLIDDEIFSEVDLRRQAMAFVQEVGGKHAIAWLDILTPSSERAYAPGKAAELTSLLQYRERQQTLLSQNFNVARVFVRSGRGVLQIRHQSGRVEHIVFGEYDDPLVFDAAGFLSKLVLAQIKRCSPLNRRLPSQAPFACIDDTLELYFRVAHLPSPEQASAMLLRLRGEFGTTSMSLEFRRVAWCEASARLSAPPFEDRTFSGRCEDWRKEPIVAVWRSPTGMKYTSLDGRSNITLPLDIP